MMSEIYGRANVGSGKLRSEISCTLEQKRLQQVTVIMVAVLEVMYSII